MAFMEFAEAIRKVLSEPGFAAEMKQKAQNALMSVSVDDAEWEEFLSHFARDASGLLALKAPDQPSGCTTVTPGIPTGAHAMAVAALSTAECTMTTTTTIPLAKGAA